MPQITINLGNVEAAAVAAAAANAGISDQAFVEQIVQAHLASMAPQHGPTFTREGGMLISALAQTGATAGKVFNLGDILKAWGIADPTNNVADLKKGKP